MTPAKLASAVMCPVSRAAQWLPHLEAAMAAYEINTAARQSAFLAQIGHESGHLVYVREIWGPTAAQSGYEGRADLGNNHPGDGYRYRGRGLIQITGRDNYRKCGEALGIPLEDHPELLELAAHAAMSAAWFWSIHGLNALADAGDFEHITRRINGGLNGEAERLALWSSAREALA